MLWGYTAVFNNRISMFTLWDNYRNKTDEQILLKAVVSILPFLTTVCTATVVVYKKCIELQRFFNRRIALQT